MKRLTLCAMLGFLLTNVSTSIAQCVVYEDHVFVQPAPQDHDWYGQSVVVDGDFFAVAAVQRNANQGAVYVYHRVGNTWPLAHTLTPTNPTTDDRFGTGLALDGDILAVGAPGRDGPSMNEGFVYVYHWNGTSWIPQTIPPPAPSGSFGFSVALEGNRLVVGAPHENAETGAAYVYEYDGTWTLVKRLEATTSQGAGDAFGIDVDLSGDAVLVGAYTDAAHGRTNAGSAYVFREDGGAWAEEAYLTASDGLEGDTFGFSLAIEDSLIIVGSSQDDDNGLVDVGSLYTFENVGGVWVERPKTRPFNPVPGIRFARDVALNDGVAAVSTERASRPGENKDGSVHVFHWDGTLWHGHLLRSRIPQENAGFGRSVSVSDGNVLAGAYVHDNGGAMDTGIAYLFGNQEIVLDIVPNNAPPGTLITFNGCKGKPLTQLGLAFVEVQGFPNFGFVLFGDFDSQGHWTLSTTVPQGPQGLLVGFKIYGIARSCHVVESNMVTVQF